MSDRPVLEVVIADCGEMPKETWEEEPAAAEEELQPEVEAATR